MSEDRRDASGGIRFEPAVAADAGTLLALMREYYAFDHLPFDEAAAGAALERLLADSSFGRAWIVRDGSEAAGYFVLTLGYSLEFHGRDAFLDELYLREPYRGRGLGGQAIAVAEEACRRLGVQALHLEVERQNERAQAVYRKLGFRDHDRYLLTKWVLRDDEPGGPAPA